MVKGKSFTSKEKTREHFAALERPEDLVREIREFFRPLREPRSH
jgi:hypothetical protein